MAEEEVNVEETIKPSGLNGLVVERLPRACRWTLHSSESDDVSMWISEVSYDLVNKKLRTSVMESGTHDAFTWLEDLSSGPPTEATLKLYDSSGKEIFSLLFTAMKMTSHNCSFDYSNSDVVRHKVEFDFNSVRVYK